MLLPDLLVLGLVGLLSFGLSYLGASVGLVFGQLEIKSVMHRVLRNYRLELAHPGYTPRYDFAGMPMPIDGMPIVLRPLG